MIRIFNKKIIKKLNLKKKITSFILAGVMAFNLSGCLNNSNKNNNENREPDKQEELHNNIEKDNIIIDGVENKIEYDENTVDSESILKDTSEEYSYAYVGDGEDFSIDDDNFIEYKDNNNAFTRPKANYSDENVKINEDMFNEYNMYLDSINTEIPYSNLFNIEHLLDRKNQEQKIIHHTNSFNFKNNEISENELFNIVKINNDKYPKYDYRSLNDKELHKICGYITEMINYNLKNNQFVDKESLSCNISNLKIFEEKNVTNARITYDNVLTISPDMIESLQTTIRDDDLNAFKMTICHEAAHLFQLNCDDEVDKTIGNKIGFNVKWHDEPINSLFWPWYYEGSAETMMTDYLNTDNIVYENMTNYIKFLKLVQLPNLDFNINSIENVSSSRNVEDLYNIMDLKTEEDKVEFLKLMYALEVVQNAPEEFSRIYCKYKNIESSILPKEEYDNIRRELKAAVCLKLSVKFYKNLTNLIYTENISLYDIYYLVTTFESELESHLYYDSVNIYSINREFMEEYTNIQNNFFISLKTENKINEDLKILFENYSYKNKFNLSFLSIGNRKFIINRNKELIKHNTTGISKTLNNFKKYEKVLQK